MVPRGCLNPLESLSCLARIDALISSRYVLLPFAAPFIYIFFNSNFGSRLLFSGTLSRAWWIFKTERSLS